MNIINKSKRQCLIEVFENGTKQLAPLLIGASWWKDASRDALNVPKALATFRKAIQLGQAWASPSLVRASYVAMAVMHDEYADAPDDALAILDEAAAAFGAADAYLLKQRAMILFHQQKYEEAAAAFAQALAGDGLDNVERAYAGRTGGLAAAYQDDWNAAERFFLMGASAAEQLIDLQSMIAGLKADAAFARWKQGRHADALRLYAAVLALLEAIPFDTDLQSRHVHTLVRHCLGWIDMSMTDISGSDITEPPPGACSNPEPHEGLKDRSLIDMSAVWGLLGNIDTRLGTGLDLLSQAERKGAGVLPLIVRLRDRFIRYRALWQGADLPRTVSMIIDVLEGSQVDAAQCDAWGPSTIPPLPEVYWDDKNKRIGLLFPLLAASVLVTCLHPNSPLPVTEWRDDMRVHHIGGPEVERFFALLTGTQQQVDGSLLEDAALALRRIREDTLSRRSCTDAISSS